MFLIAGKTKSPPARLPATRPRHAYGRFLQPDPIGYDDGMNMYGYAGGDPVNGIDPKGTSSIPQVCIETNVSVGGYAGASGSSFGDGFEITAAKYQQTFCYYWRYQISGYVQSSTMGFPSFPTQTKIHKKKKAKPEPKNKQRPIREDLCG